MWIFFNDKPRYGCWSGWFYMKNDKFTPACTIHDMDYDDKPINKLKADWNFLKNMLKLATNPWDYIKAILYYITVSTIGIAFWYYKDIIKWFKKLNTPNSG